MSIDMQQFHAVFLSEAHEHIDALESLFIAFDTESYDEQSIHQIFRSAHSKIFLPTCAKLSSY
jgi:two-component system chemotaxis sensor kinase CheA